VDNDGRSGDRSPCPGSKAPARKYSWAVAFTVRSFGVGWGLRSRSNKLSARGRRHCGVPLRQCRGAAHVQCEHSPLRVSGPLTPTGFVLAVACRREVLSSGRTCSELTSLSLIRATRTGRAISANGRGNAAAEGACPDQSGRRHAEPTEVRDRLLTLDAFTVPGNSVIYVVQQRQVLDEASRGSTLFRAMLATVIWHEVAHLAGTDERGARKAEEDLWTRFVRDGVADQVTALRYLQALKRRPYDQLLASR